MMPAILRYHGGKVRLAYRIVAAMPLHETYVEPYGGGAAVLLAKSRARLEVYNDLDGDMVNLFRVIRDAPDELAAAIAATPFARAEHELSYRDCTDDLERARRVLIRSHFGHGSSGIHRKTGFRAAGLRAGVLPVHTWASLPAAVRETAERMRGVVIERRPAVDVMRAHDSAGALHYVDPPYLPETRDRGRDYAHEMTRADHIAMLDAILRLRGSVILSGYASPLYDEALAGWNRVEIASRADRAAERTEVLWMRLREAGALFSGGRYEGCER
ncbi:MAG: DNA adenine methylase [Rhodobacteraceae bacterium]|jgi:DNA adenine methylase|nr:DNA adenine methylase [Paracoccaceae bacterium]